VRHADKVKKLGRTKQHREAMFRNLVTALFEHERIRTTLPKAKAAKNYAERILSFARRGDLAARREVGRFIQDREVLKKLFDVLGPRFKDRAGGGLTRVYRLGQREGDGAEMALLELVIREQKHKEKQAQAGREKPGKKAAKEKAETAA
jgi:large subunit ribosomal protein L17